jgi:DNA polymerase-4
VASNKLVAKTANDVGKAAARSSPASPAAKPPKAITVVPPGEEAAFLAPLPIEALWGVGPKTAERLKALEIRTIGDLAGWPEKDLARRFGKHGQELSVRSRGLDDRPIVTSHEAKSVSQETTFTQDVRDREVLRQTLQELSAGVARRLHAEGLSGTTVKLKVRWPDFTTLTRQTTLDHGTDESGEIFTTALELFERVWQPGQAVRLLGVGASGLGQPFRQLTLWEGTLEKDRRLQEAVEALQERFGQGAILRGSQLERRKHE